MIFQSGFVESTFEFLDYFEPKVGRELENILAHNKILGERSADIGVMPKEVALLAA